jgi:diketogulonate reductase-like aldo/keto reductase
LCDAKRRGLTRHIGVSNFPPRFVEAALEVADEPIAVNQVEHHPYLDQRELMAVCARHDIALTSYSPLGRGRLLEEPVLGEIAAVQGKTPAQIVLRWHLQQPMNIAIPRSSSPRRISENFSIFDFELSADEMARISGLARPDGRMVNAGYPSDWNGAPES